VSSSSPAAAGHRRTKDTAARTGKATPAHKPRPLLRSPIARLIFASNLAGLVILIIGALFLNEIRQGLVGARKDSLLETAQIVSSFLTEVATEGEPTPVLDVGKANPKTWVKAAQQDVNTSKCLNEKWQPHFELKR
jgi:hypothetical protein